MPDVKDASYQDAEHRLRRLRVFIHFGIRLLMLAWHPQSPGSPSFIPTPGSIYTLLKVRRRAVAQSELD